MIFIKSNLNLNSNPVQPEKEKETNNMSNQQLQQLIQQVEGASDVLNNIASTLPERPSRLKLKSQLAPVINVLQSVRQQLDVESNTQSQKEAVLGAALSPVNG